ncbi:hypothetical protein Q7P37_009073 [Cladosporium fusiforme]
MGRGVFWEWSLGGEEGEVKCSAVQTGVDSGVEQQQQQRADWLAHGLLGSTQHSTATASSHGLVLLAAAAAGRRCSALGHFAGVSVRARPRSGDGLNCKLIQATRDGPSKHPPSTRTLPPTAYLPVPLRLCWPECVFTLNSPSATSQESRHNEMKLQNTDTHQTPATDQCDDIQKPYQSPVAKRGAGYPHFTHDSASEQKPPRQRERESQYRSP